MRRRRHHLQVSTFPFMAVLLCAMGSLILLLFILDRRAKRAEMAKVLKAQEIAQKQALQKAQKARQQALKKARDAQEEAKKRAREAQQRAQKQAELLAKQQAEWELLQKQLHDKLLRENQHLLNELQMVALQTKEAQQKTSSHKDAFANLFQQWQKEKKSVAEEQKNLQNLIQERKEKGNRSKKVKKELLDLTVKLSELENTVEALKQFKNRTQETYSVLPYRGKHGESRRPVYVECTSSGVIFHPDGPDLQGLAFSPLTVRRELERRVRDQTAHQPLDKKQKPYLFLLVRPTGLRSYYGVRTALAGLPIDFGYELIDEEWALDFSGVGREGSGVEGMALGVGREGLGVGSEGLGVGSGDGLEISPSPGVASPGKPTSFPGMPASPGKPTPSPGIKFGGNAPWQAHPNNKFAGAHGKNKTDLEGTAAPSGKKLTQNNKGEPGALATGVSEPGASVTGVNKPTTGKPGASVTGVNKPTTGEPGASATGVGAGHRFGKAKKPIPLSRLKGNRDWYIPVVCKRDSVYLPISRKTFFPPGSKLGTSKSEALNREVWLTIARRQASVSPGSPPYRPILRFEVFPEGLRSYHWAFLVLENLRVHMIRENVQKKRSTLADYYQK